MSFLVFNFLKSLNKTPQLDLRHKRFIGVNFCEKNEAYVGRGKETLPDEVQVQNLCSREGKEELGKKYHVPVQVKENLTKPMGSLQIKVNHQRSPTFSKTMLALISLLCAFILLLLGK